MSTRRRALVSEAEFLALPETTLRQELLDGEVLVPPSPTVWHQELLGRVVTALRGWASETGARATIIQAPIDVRFGPNRILQPDAIVVLDILGRDTATPLTRVPEICIEVLSTDRAYDRVTKRYVYAEAGVQEYWIVDPAGVIERARGPGFAISEELDDVLESELLPGFQLDVARLFS